MEKIYMEQSQSFLAKEELKKAYLIDKSFVWPKKHPKAWYNEIHACFIEKSFERSKIEPT